MADSSKRVVKLNPTRFDADDAHLYARYPAPFREVKEKGQRSLLGLMQSLFDNVDDALFELADRAESNAEQNMFFESMREVRIKRRGMEMGFTQGIKEAFRQLTGVEGAAKSAEPPLLEDIASSSLSLVENEQLEELVAVDSMVAKATNQFGGQLTLLTKRLDSLIDNQAVDDSNNPFGPAVVCRSFVDVCATLELDIKAKLVLFKLFDRYVVSQLGDVYQLTNQLLIDSGILPNFQQRKQKRQRRVAHAEQTASEDVFSSLQNLLHNIPQKSFAADMSSGLAPAGQAPQIPRNNLLQLLQQVQQVHIQNLLQQPVATWQGYIPQQVDVQQLLGQLLSERMPSQPMSIGQVDDDAINLVAMLFQFILDDRSLAAPMKALIARLQIPLIKVAMLDKSFFSKGGHPARKLLNEIATASLGWMPSDKPEDDPLYKKVESVVETLLNDFDEDAGIFQDVLTDFMAFMEADSRRRDLIEQRTLNAEDGKAKSEIARTKVQDVLNEKVAGETLPKVVVQLLEGAWSNVLFLICLKEGEDSESWSDALQTVDDLLWSVRPMTNNRDRQQLLKRVPTLLKNLRTGLTKIGYNPFDMNQLFEELEAIHLKQLSELTGPKLESVAKAPESKPKAATSKSLDELLDERSNNDTSLQQLDEELASSFDQLASIMDDSVEEIELAAADQQYVEKIVLDGAREEPDTQSEPALAEDDPCFKKVDSIRTGSWIEIRRDDDKKFRCRLAAIIRGTGKYIFVNRSGMKVEEHTRESLAMAIKTEAIGLLDDGLLFDRALESVIGSLRDIKAQPA